MDFPKIKEYLTGAGYPDFRYRQIVKNYYSGRYTTFSQMTDLSLELRGQLDEKFTLLSVSEDKLLSGPLSQKARLSLSDGSRIETVLMDYGSWQTACLSTQVGCPLGCTFCATGKMGFKRNLTVDEIIDQILFWRASTSSLREVQPRSNPVEIASSPKAPRNDVNRIVFMGMGEPFLNWDNLLLALDIIKKELVIGARKISISTAGVAPRIIDFANLDTEINLAVSLHSADQATRDKMMPISRQYSLDTLHQALDYYVSQTNRQVFFEYLLAQDVNDTPHHLQLLIDFMKSNRLFYLNLIPLNPIKGGLTPSLNLSKFEAGLTRARVDYSVRQSIGRSIDSACGQLIVE
jgi:23S rRNA (adenine2503-C2)-methyltransferase